MSLVIGKERAVSHSCLVASCIEMPEHLEEEIENLDDIFQNQMNTVNNAAISIRQSLKHPELQNWPHIEDITKACTDRAKYIMMNDYIRAMSYGAMRMVNSRLTDVLNAIMPIKKFLDETLEKIKEKEKKDLEEKKASEQVAANLEEEVSTATDEAISEKDDSLGGVENKISNVRITVTCHTV